MNPEYKFMKDVIPQLIFSCVSPRGCGDGAPIDLVFRLACISRVDVGRLTI